MHYLNEREQLIVELTDLIKDCITEKLSADDCIHIRQMLKSFADPEAVIEPGDGSKKLRDELNFLKDVVKQTVATIPVLVGGKKKNIPVRHIHTVFIAEEGADKKNYKVKFINGEEFYLAGWSITKVLKTYPHMFIDLSRDMLLSWVYLDEMMKIEKDKEVEYFVKTIGNENPSYKIFNDRYDRVKKRKDLFDKYMNDFID